MKILATALLASVLVGALAPMAMAEEQCLRPNMVTGWKVADKENLVLIDRAGHTYDVVLAKGCTGLQWSAHMGFNTGLPGDFGLTCITRNDFITVPARGGNVTQRCLINNVQPVPGVAPAAAAH